MSPLRPVTPMALDIRRRVTTVIKLTLWTVH